MDFGDDGKMWNETGAAARRPGQFGLRRVGAAMKVAGALVGLLWSCAAASAQWQIEAVKDQASNPAIKRGFVQAKAEDATLRLDCVNGAQLLSISVDRDLERGMIGAVITFDERKPKSLLLQVFSNPRNIPLFDISTRDLVRARRLRIELQPIEGSSVAYDFDTSGGKSAVKAVVCGAKPKSLFRRLSR